MKMRKTRRRLSAAPSTGSSTILFSRITILPSLTPSCLPSDIFTLPLSYLIKSSISGTTPRSSLLLPPLLPLLPLPMDSLLFLPLSLLPPLPSIPPIPPPLPFLFLLPMNPSLLTEGTSFLSLLYFPFSPSSSLPFSFPLWEDEIEFVDFFFIFCFFFVGFFWKLIKRKMRRIIFVLRKWIDKYYNVDFKDDPDLMVRLNKFINETLIQQGFSELSRSIKTSIDYVPPPPFLPPPLSLLSPPPSPLPPPKTLQLPFGFFPFSPTSSPPIYRE